MNSASNINTNVQPVGIQQPSPLVSNTPSITNSTDLQSKKAKYGKTVVYIILILLGSGFLYLILYFTILPKNEIVISDQILGNSIHIKKVSLTERSMIIVTPKNKVGKPDLTDVVAYSEPLLPDTYTDFDLDISPLEADLEEPKIASSSFGRRKTIIKSGDTLFALISKLPEIDDLKARVNRDLKSKNDIYYMYTKNIFGRPIMVRFTVK